jgi:hypothetical protein
MKYINILIPILLITIVLLINNNNKPIIILFNLILLIIILYKYIIYETFQINEVISNNYVYNKQLNYGNKLNTLHTNLDILKKSYKKKK